MKNYKLKLHGLIVIAIIFLTSVTYLNFTPYDSKKDEVYDPSYFTDDKYTYEEGRDKTKVEILSKQHFRCNKCKTEITINNIDNSMLSYIQPLDIGGNTIQNLQVVCKHCFQY